jgi:Ner family transcriptional regulator
MKRVSARSRGWSWNRVVYELRERGLSVAEVARQAGFSTVGSRSVQTKRWPRMQAAIAKSLGVSPITIWPDRYDDEGLPLRLKPRRGGAATNAR